MGMPPSGVSVSKLQMVQHHRVSQSPARGTRIPRGRSALSDQQGTFRRMSTTDFTTSVEAGRCATVVNGKRDQACAVTVMLALASVMRTRIALVWVISHLLSVAGSDRTIGCQRSA